jgi:Spy/CpxP family protein refolding chaperone
MLTLIRRLAMLTIFIFLGTLVSANLAISDSGSSAIENLKGTGSTGSFSYKEEQKTKDSAIGYGAHKQNNQGSKAKPYSHSSPDSAIGYGAHKQNNQGSKAKSYSHSSSGHISGSHTQKKPEDSQSKSYSHGKSGHEKSKHGSMDGYGKSYGHKKSEGSKSKSYSHGKSSHGKSKHGSMGGYGKSYGHKKGSHGGHGQSPFKHVMHYKNKLSLTDAQIQTMKELDADFNKIIIQAIADHKIAHIELDLQVHSGEVDEAKIRIAGTKIVASKTNKILAMINAKIQLLNLLTAEQRLKMAKMH